MSNTKPLTLCKC